MGTSGSSASRGTSPNEGEARIDREVYLQLEVLVAVNVTAGFALTQTLRGYVLKRWDAVAKVTVEHGPSASRGGLSADAFVLAVQELHGAFNGGKPERGDLRVGTVEVGS
eukprot:24272-Amorphochlora_amoeboformis.AAC.1